MARFLLDLPGVRSLHDRELLFPIVIVVAAVLANGVLDRAAQAEREPQPSATVEMVEPPPLGLVRPALRGDLEKTPLTYFSDFWAQLATEVESHLAVVSSSRVGGVVIEPGVAVTTVVVVDALDAETARIQLAREVAESEESTREMDQRLPVVRAVRRVGTTARLR